MPKRDRARSNAGRIIFWVLSPLWLALLAALALFAVLSHADFPLDDQNALAEAPPLAASERFAFHAADQTIDIAIDAADMAYLAEHGDGIDVTELAEPLSGYGLTLDGYGMRFTPEGARINIKLKAFGFVPVPIQAALDVSPAEKGDITVRVTGAHITKFYMLTAADMEEKFNIAQEDLCFTVEGAKIHPRLSTLSGIRFDEGSMILTCDLSQTMFKELIAEPSFATASSNFSSDSMVLKAFNGMTGTGAARKFGADYDALFAFLEEDPSRIEEIRLDVLSLSTPDQAALAFEGNLKDYNARFLPKVTEAAVFERHEVYAARTDDCVERLTGLAAKLKELYVNKELLYAGDSFVKKGAEDVPITVEDLTDDFSLYADILDPAKTRIILCCGNTEKVGFGFNSPFSKMPRAKKAKVNESIFTREVYMPVIMTKLASGKCAFIYLYDNAGTPMLSVDTFKEHKYDAFMAEELIPGAYFGPNGDNT